MTTQGDRLVYVVDDDEAVRESTLVLLESEGIAALGFASAQQFLRDFERTRAGCLVLDVHMPQMSGIELLAALRADGVATPALVLTGRSDPALEELARRHGASMLSKPPPGDELLVLVRAALERRRVT